MAGGVLGKRGSDGKHGRNETGVSVYGRNYGVGFRVFAGALDRSELDRFTLQC